MDTISNLALTAIETETRHAVMNRGFFSDSYLEAHDQKRRAYLQKHEEVWRQLTSSDPWSDEYKQLSDQARGLSKFLDEHFNMSSALRGANILRLKGLSGRYTDFRNIISDPFLS